MLLVVLRIRRDVRPQPTGRPADLDASEQVRRRQRRRLAVEHATLGAPARHLGVELRARLGERPRLALDRRVPPGRRPAVGERIRDPERSEQLVALQRRLVRPRRRRGVDHRVERRHRFRPDHGDAPAAGALAVRDHDRPAQRSLERGRGHDGELRVARAGLELLQVALREQRQALRHDLALGEARDGDLRAVGSREQDDALAARRRRDLQRRRRFDRHAAPRHRVPRCGARWRRVGAGSRGNADHHQQHPDPR